VPDKYSYLLTYLLTYISQHWLNEDTGLTLALDRSSTVVRLLLIRVGIVGGLGG